MSATTSQPLNLLSTDEAMSKKQITRMNKLQKKLRREMGSAIADYNMIEAGDRVMCCLSGGKDSYAMLDILLNLQQRAPVKFELVVVNLGGHSFHFSAKEHIQK